MAAPPTSPQNHDRDSLAQTYLNDPNFDVDAELKRRSSESHRRAAHSTALNSGPSIRRRPNAGHPPPLSSPTPASPSRSGFPLIPQYLPSPPPLSRQPSYHLPPPDQPLYNFAAHPNPATWFPPASVSTPSFISDSKPALNSPNSYHRHSTGVEDEYFDMDSIAQSTSSQRFSRDTYGYDKKRGSNDDDDLEMDTRSEIDFEEYVLSFPSTTRPYSKQSPTQGHIGVSFPTSQSEPVVFLPGRYN